MCSRYRNQPPPSVAQRILELSGKEYRYPASGELLGNWKNGEKLAPSGKGGHIGTIQPDPPGRERGANCYACHALAPTELRVTYYGMQEFELRDPDGYWLWFGEDTDEPPTEG